MSGAAAAPMIQQEALASEAYMEAMEDSKSSAEERSRAQKQTRFKRYQLEREQTPEKQEQR